MHDGAEERGGRRLRVVTLVDGIGLGGGGERIAREIIVRLDRDRFEPILCVSRWSERHASQAGAPEALAQLREAGVRFVGLARRSAADLPAWRGLLRILRDGTDVLHAHKFGSNAWAAMLGSIARTPTVIAHEHTWSFEGQPLRRAIDRRLIAPRVDAFLAVSREDRRRMIEVEGIDPAKLIFVPNGIPDPAPPGDGDIRAELGIPSDAPVIGTVCALRPQKALEVLVAAAGTLAERLPDLRVLVAGDGPERESLQRRIDDHGLARIVTLLGRRTDVPDLLRGLDVAVCCSDFEGTPLSVLEYMEAGLPVVGTRVGGVPDLITPGEHGLLVDPRDPGGLAAAVESLLLDAAAARRMGERGRARRRAEFSIDNTVEALEEIYLGLASGLSAAELGSGDEATGSRD